MQDALSDAEAPVVKSWVYVIGPADTQVVKIGKAVNVEARRRTLQTSSPHKLVTRWATPGGLRLERWLHDRFKPLHLNGEWFDFGDRDPIVEVRSAVREFATAGFEEPGVYKMPSIYEDRIVLGPQWDARWPRRDDPDCDHPDFQPDTCGCRCYTPTELRAMGEDPKKALTVYISTYRPLPGGWSCYGSIH